MALMETPPIARTCRWDCGHELYTYMESTSGKRYAARDGEERRSRLRNDCVEYRTNAARRPRPACFAPPVPLQTSVYRSCQMRQQRRQQRPLASCSRVRDLGSPTGRLKRLWMRRIAKRSWTNPCTVRSWSQLGYHMECRRWLANSTRRSTGGSRRCRNRPS